MAQQTNLDTLLSAAGPDERRTGGVRHDAAILGPIVARLIGGSEVRLIDVSRRGVLLESEARLLIGARATIKITTTDTAVTVRGEVVRSRVYGVKNGSLVYHTAMRLDEELGLVDEAPVRRVSAAVPTSVPIPAPSVASTPPAPPLDGPSLRTFAPGLTGSATGSERAYSPAAITGADAPHDDVVELLANVPHDLAELRRRASVNNW
jgi:hypothetical protein